MKEITALHPSYRRSCMGIPVQISVYSVFKRLNVVIIDVFSIQYSRGKCGDSISIQYSRVKCGYL